MLNFLYIGSAVIYATDPSFSIFGHEPLIRASTVSMTAVLARVLVALHRFHVTRSSGGRTPRVFPFTFEERAEFDPVKHGKCV